MGFFGTLIASWLGCNLASPTKYIYDNIHINTVLEQKPDEPEDKTISELVTNPDGSVQFEKTEMIVGENGTKMIIDL